jgi:hypothetical protein
MIEACCPVSRAAMIELSTGNGHGGQSAATGVHTSPNKHDLMNLLTFLPMARSAPPPARVTVTMPGELVAGIDRIEGNRSRFITEAVRHELQRRQRQELLRSLEAPHPHSAATVAVHWGHEPAPGQPGAGGSGADPPP